MYLGAAPPEPLVETKGAPLRPILSMASSHGWREAAVSATSVASDVVAYLGVSLRLGCATVEQVLAVARNAAPQGAGWCWQWSYK